jgi:MFS family permease
MIPYQKVSAPLLGTLFMIIGVTFIVAFLPIHLANHGYTPKTIGFVASSYYLGMLIGAFKMEPMICRIGHIRSFAAFVACMIIAIAVPALYNQLFLWFLSRTVIGICLSGLFIVLESWFLSVSTVKTRGVYLALYMVALGLGAAIAPFLMNAGTLQDATLFNIAIVFLAMAILPLTVQKSPAPELSPPSAMTLRELFLISPLGVIGCGLSGFGISSIQSFLPIILNKPLFSTFEISAMLAAMLAGSMVFQYPAGYLSDKYGRRSVLLALCLMIMLSTFIYGILFPSLSAFSFASIFCLGGALYSLYPVTINYVCNFIKQEDLVKTTQSLLLFYGIGAVFGPIVTGEFVGFFGDEGMLVSIGIPFVIYGAFVIRSLLVHKRTEDHFYKHAELPRTTPVVSELDPRADIGNKD